MKSLSTGLSPQRSIRVPDELWDLFVAVCEHEGETVSQTLRRAMEVAASAYEVLPAYDTEHGEVSGFVYYCDICDNHEHSDTFASAVETRDHFGGLCSYCADKTGRL